MVTLQICSTAPNLIDVLHPGIKGLHQEDKESQKRSRPCMQEKQQASLSCCQLGQTATAVAQCGLTSAGDDKAASKEELGKGRQQVGDSRSRLLKLKAERDLEVSAVRVAGDERESQRRSKEEEERQVPGNFSCSPLSQFM